MKLPQELQQFPTSTLLVVSDTVSAKFWLIGGDDMEELDGLVLPHEHNQGSERASSSSDGTRLGGSDTPSDAPRFHHYVHDLVEKLSQLVHGHAIAQIHLVMPANVEHAVADHLPHDVSAKIGKRVHVDVMKESPLEIVRRVLGA